RAVGIALDLQELGVALGVLPGVGNDRAADRAVRAERVDFLGAGNAQLALDGDGLGEIEAQRGEPDSPAAGRSQLDEVATTQLLHVTPSSRSIRSASRHTRT